MGSTVQERWLAGCCGTIGLLMSACTTSEWLDTTYRPGLVEEYEEHFAAASLEDLRAKAQLSHERSRADAPYIHYTLAQRLLDADPSVWTPPERLGPPVSKTKIPEFPLIFTEVDETTGQSVSTMPCMGGVWVEPSEPVYWLCLAADERLLEYQTVTEPGRDGIMRSRQQPRHSDRGLPEAGNLLRDIIHGATP